MQSRSGDSSYLGTQNKKRRRWLPQLNKKTEEINKPINEKSLLLQLKNIDCILKEHEYQLFHGYLFSQAKLSNPKLVPGIMSCLKKEADIVESGFKIIHLHEHPSVASTSQGRLTEKVQSIDQKLKKLSLKNVDRFETIKLDHINHMNRRDPKNSGWSVLTRGQHNQHKSIQSQQSDISKIMSTVDNSQQIRKTRRSYYTRGDSQNHKQIQKYQSRNMMTEVSEIPEVPQDSTITKEDIYRLLRRETDQILTIWLPPATYPQFYGIFTVSLRMKPSYKSNRCLIKKFFFYRHGLKSTFFNAILEYLSSYFETQIEVLEIKIEKSQFLRYLEPCGWKMKSWESTNKIAIVYTRQFI